MSGGVGSEKSRDFPYPDWILSESNATSIAPVLAGAAVALTVAGMDTPFTGHGGLGWGSGASVARFHALGLPTRHDGGGDRF
jgi:hypothetical protein